MQESCLDLGMVFAYEKRGMDLAKYLSVGPVRAVQFLNERLLFFRTPNKINGLACEINGLGAGRSINARCGNKAREENQEVAPGTGSVLAYWRAANDGRHKRKAESNGTLQERKPDQAGAGGPGGFAGHPGEQVRQAGRVGRKGRFGHPDGRRDHGEPERGPARVPGSVPGRVAARARFQAIPFKNRLVF